MEYDKKKLAQQERVLEYVKNNASKFPVGINNFAIFSARAYSILGVMALGVYGMIYLVS